MKAGERGGREDKGKEEEKGREGGMGRRRGEREGGREKKGREGGREGGREREREGGRRTGSDEEEEKRDSILIYGEPLAGEPLTEASQCGLHLDACLDYERPPVDAPHSGCRTRRPLRMCRGCSWG
jgi:hypothetical protein